MVAIATSPSCSCRVSAISAFCWPTTQTHPITDSLVAIVHTKPVSPKIGCHGNVPQNLEIGSVFIGQIVSQNPPLESNSVSLTIISSG